MAKAKRAYLNRELSWIEFNARVLGEARDPRTPLLERLKFTGIFSANFDEFFMVRVAGLKRQVSKRRKSRCPTGLTPPEQLAAVRKRTIELIDTQQQLLASELFTSLARKRVRIHKYGNLNPEQRQIADDYFLSTLFPLLTPLRIDEDFPFAENLAIHLAVTLRPGDGGDPVHAMLRIPRKVPRFVDVTGKGKANVVPIESIVVHHMNRFFPGFEIETSLLFRVTRDADLGVDEGRDEDFVLAMEEVLVDRQTSLPVRIETGKIESETEIELLDVLLEGLRLSADDHYEMEALVGAENLIEFSNNIDIDALHDPPWPAASSEFVRTDESIFESIRRADSVVHHPYESYEPILSLVTEASRDPEVLAIKITLYRTSGDSPIVHALGEAAERGIQVTAFVELKARFDEEQNINWAHELEQVGVIVVHGIANLKVHAKALLIVRREADGITRYVHLSTGNYNDRTARLYSDIGFLTANDEFAADVGLFFNAITGYSSVPNLRHLIMAPTSLKSKILDLIARETIRCRESGSGRIAAKLNSLADPEVIDALYDASNAGVRVDLNVRGICMLIPGVKEMSEHIRVVSIVDRYLEHSRIIFFENGGAPEGYLSSADWMPRNLERRIELMFPIHSPSIADRVSGFLDIYFSDTTKSHRLMKDGKYKKPKRKPEERRAQQLLYEEACARDESLDPSIQREFVVRKPGL